MYNKMDRRERGEVAHDNKGKFPCANRRTGGWAKDGSTARGGNRKVLEG